MAQVPQILGNMNIRKFGYISDTANTANAKSVPTRDRACIGRLLRGTKQNKMVDPRRSENLGPMAPKCPNLGPGLRQRKVGPSFEKGSQFRIFFLIGPIQWADNPTESDVDPTRSHKARYCQKTLMG